MSEAVTAMRWKRVGYFGPSGVASMASAFALSITCSDSRSLVLRYPLPTAVSSLQDSRAHSDGLNGTGCATGVYPLSMVEITTLTAELKSCVVIECPKLASSKTSGSLGLYLNEALASLIASLWPRLLASFIAWGISTRKGFPGTRLKVPLEGVGGRVSSFSPERLSGGVGFGVRVNGGGDCWSAIRRERGSG